MRTHIDVSVSVGQCPYCISDLKILNKHTKKCLNCHVEYIATDDGWREWAPVGSVGHLVNMLETKAGKNGSTN